MAENKSDTTGNVPEDEVSTSDLSAKSSLKGDFWRGIYVAGYVLQGLRRHKRRSLSLLIGIMIGVALVASVFVWTDTGKRVAIDEYFSDFPFHYYCVQRSNYPLVDDPNAVYPLRDYVNREPTTKSTHVVYASVGLFEINHLRPPDPYLPWPYMRGIKDCQAFFVDNNFLARAESAFTFEGSFRITPGSVLLSRRVIQDLETVRGLDVGVGSIINVAIARNYHSPSTIGAINPTYLNGLLVAGIYEPQTRLEPLFESFPTSTRVNWGPFSGQELVFGWLDSMILSNSLLSIPDANSIALNVEYPRLLVEVDPIAFYTVGIEQTVPILDRVISRIEENFNVFVGGRDGLNTLIYYIQAYDERRIMGILVLPMVILSILLTTFTTTLFISGRRPEVAILRSRGASYRQLYATFIFEFIIVAIIGLILGGFIGIILGCMLPSASSFLVFDNAIFIKYLSLSKIDPIAWIFSGIVTIIPAAIYTLFVTRSFLRTELYTAIRGENSRWKIKNWMQVLYAIFIILGIWPLIIAAFSIPLSVDVALFLFVATIGFWILLTDAIARIIRPGIAGFSNLLRPVFGQKSSLFAKSVRVRRSRVIPLLIILLLTFSVTIFSAVEAQTYQSHLNRQIEYYIGSDIRIYSSSVPAQRVQEIINLPEIQTATTFIEVEADIGTQEFRLLGVDPTAYAEIGNWDPTSMVGESYLAVFNRLEANPNGIILPNHLALLLNKQVGDTVNIRVRDQRLDVLEVRTFDIVGIVYTAPGFGYANPSDPGASISPEPGFGFQKGHPFAFCHWDYFLVDILTRIPYARVDQVRYFLAGVRPSSNIFNAIQAVRSLDFVHTSWSPFAFDLESVYPDGYLFSQGIISLLSVGFLASLAISIVALTVFVNTIVSERKTEYAIMRALGGTSRQVTAIVFGEFVGLILAAFLFSLIIGITFSWILMFTLLRLFPQPYIIPFTIIYPISLLVAVLGLVVLGLLAGAYLPARRAGEVQVTTILRNL